MKTFIKNLGILIVVILTVGLCLNVYLAGAEEKYKCFAERFPVKAKINGFSALGESVASKRTGLEYKVIAEAAHQKQLKWFQFIDITPIDGKADAVMEIHICLKGHIHMIKRDPQETMNRIINYCVANQHNINDILHYAPGIDKNSMIKIRDVEEKNKIEAQRYLTENFLKQLVLVLIVVMIFIVFYTNLQERYGL